MPRTVNGTGQEKASVGADERPYYVHRATELVTWSRPEVGSVVLGSFSREQRPAPEGEVDLPDAAHLDEASLMSDVETITVGDVA